MIFCMVHPYIHILNDFSNCIYSRMVRTFSGSLYNNVAKQSLLEDGESKHIHNISNTHTHTR